MTSTAAVTSFESRLRRLEVLLGLPGESSNSMNNEIESRLVQLERHFYQPQSTTSTTSSSNTTSIGTNPFAAWIEIDRMMEDLSAGTALTHQSKSGIAAPMIYRRQDVLACADRLKLDMEHVSMIVNSILVDNNNQETTTNNGTISEEQVVNAPILIKTIVSQEQQERMDNLSSKLIDIQRRTVAESDKLDQMVYHYHQLIQALSAKLVAAEEVIRQFE